MIVIFFTFIISFPTFMLVISEIFMSKKANLFFNEISILTYKPLYA